MGREELTHMADQADWFRAFVERSMHEVRRAYWHVDGITSDIGAMFAVVHGGEGVLAEPHAS